MLLTDDELAAIHDRVDEDYVGHKTIYKGEIDTRAALDMATNDGRALLAHIDAQATARDAERTLADDLAAALDNAKGWIGDDLNETITRTVLARYRAARAARPAAQTTGGE